MTTDLKLRVLGYWKGPYEDKRLPDPRTLVASHWDEETRDRVVQYLRSGRLFSTELGYSWCRFKCGISDEKMGSREYTDGIWVWPEGLVHYLINHNIQLPDEFVEYAKSCHWSMPTTTPQLTETTVPDMEGWIKWAHQHKKRMRWGILMDKNAAIEIARKECQQRNWILGDPVAVHWGFFNYEVWGYANRKGGNVVIRVRKSNGKIVSAFITPH
jgi:hypothetical protein